MVVYLLIVLIIVVAIVGSHCHECEAEHKAEQAERVHREVYAQFQREHRCPRCGHIATNPQARFCSQCGRTALL